MENIKIIVGLGSCGIAAGAGKVYDEIVRIKEADNLNFDLGKTSCVGMCFREPLVEIIDETGSYLYGDVDIKRIDEIIEKHIVNFSPIKEYIVKSDMFDTPYKDYFEGQIKITLRNCGNIDPEHITEYENNRGYQAIKKITSEKIPPEDVIKSVMDSGIRGRGGAGFSTGMKWNFARNSRSDEKYVV